MEINRTFASLVVSIWLLASCDPQKVAELTEGVSTEADVRSRFGEPAAIYDEPNGERTFEYPRQPAGTTNYMISIGPDGRMIALRQVLTRTNFANVTPGLGKEHVRRMLGPPAKVQSYALKNEEVWDWRFADAHEVDVFSVTFDDTGSVKGTAITLDPQAAHQRD